MPLYHDLEGKEPNVTDGLLDTLGVQYGEKPTVEDLAAYVYALLGGQSYAHRFWKEPRDARPSGADHKRRSAVRQGCRAGPPLDLAPYLRRTLPGRRPR